MPIYKITRSPNDDDPVEKGPVAFFDPEYRRAAETIVVVTGRGDVAMGITTGQNKLGYAISFMLVSDEEREMLTRGETPPPPTGYVHPPVLIAFESIAAVQMMHEVLTDLTNRLLGDALRGIVEQDAREQAEKKEKEDEILDEPYI